MTNEVIETKIAELDTIEAQIEELKAQADKIKDELKAELDVCNVEMIDTGVHRIWYQVIAKRSVNTKALKEAGLYDKYSKESTSCTFKITKVTDK